MLKAKPIPTFKTEDEEREFWATHDSTEYFDWNNAILNPVFPNLKRSTQSTKSVTIRLPVELINDLKTMASKRDVPYQSLLKTMLYHSVREEKAKYTTD